MSNHDPNKFVLQVPLIFLTIISVLILGCNTTSVSETPQTEPVGVTPKAEAVVEQQTPLIRLTLVIDPPNAAVPLFNPTPLSDNDLRFLFGEVITINVMPQPGWEVKEWVGPVINKGRNKAQVIMDGSQHIGVRLVSEAQMSEDPNSQTVYASPTVIMAAPDVVQDIPPPYPTYTPYPTPTTVPMPYPTYTPYPTPTTMPTPYPTYTPYPTPTTVPSLNDYQVQQLVAVRISDCNTSIDKQYGETTYPTYNIRYKGSEIWLVEPIWDQWAMTYGVWEVNGRGYATVGAYDQNARDIDISRHGTGCTLPIHIQPMK